MNIVLITLLAHFPLARPHAYLDPGTGSYILQLLLATFLGTLFFVKTFWKRFYAWMRNKLSKTRESDHDDLE